MCTPTQEAAAIWCGKPHATKRIDRLATKQQHTRYKGEGMCLGAWVALPHSGVGQVWAQAPGRGYWWVASERGFSKMHESNTYLVAQARDEDVPLFEDGAA